MSELRSPETERKRKTSKEEKQSKGTDTLMRLEGYNLDLLFACCFCWRDIDPSAGDFTHLAQLKPLLCQYWMMMDHRTHTHTLLQHFGREILGWIQWVPEILF